MRIRLTRRLEGEAGGAAQAMTWLSWQPLPADRAVAKAWEILF